MSRIYDDKCSSPVAEYIVPKQRHFLAHSKYHHRQNQSPVTYKVNAL